VRKKCENCARFDAKQGYSTSEAMLPLERISLRYAFEAIGVDFAGPLKAMINNVLLKKTKRVPKAAKRRRTGGLPSETELDINYEPGAHYVVIFTCCVTRLVHFELTPSLKAESFLQAFDCFRSVRGTPKVIYSDNGESFVKTAKLLTLVEDEWEKILAGVPDVEWRFNVPRAPWWGGFFERAVRMLKDKFYRSFGTYSFSSELECVAGLRAVEYAINCRPMGHVSMDASDPRPIAPINMIMPFIDDGTVLSREDLDKQLSQMAVTDLPKISRRLISKVRNVWHTFQRGWQNELRAYHNEHGRTAESLQVGQIVLVIDKGTPHINWLRGTVLSLIRGRADPRTGTNPVRAAEVKLFNPSGTDWALRRKLQGAGARKHLLSPLEKQLVRGGSKGTLRLPVKLLIPLEFHGYTGTEKSGELPSHAHLLQDD